MKNCLIIALVLIATCAVANYIVFNPSLGSTVDSYGYIAGGTGGGGASGDPYSARVLLTFETTNVGNAAWTEDTGTLNTNHGNYFADTSAEPTRLDITNSPQNYAYGYDGVDDAIYTVAVDGITTLTKGTVCVWVNIRGDKNDQQSVLAIRSAGGTTSLLYFQLDERSDDNFRWGCYVEGAYKWWGESANQVLDPLYSVWAHFAITHNGTEPTFWVNAQPLAITWLDQTDKSGWLADVYATPEAADEIRLGDTGAEEPDVWLDYFAIYTNVLDGTAITNQMNSSNPTNCLWN